MTQEEVNIALIITGIIIIAVLCFMFYSLSSKNRGYDDGLE